MGQPIPITRRDFTAADLRAAATRINNGAVVRRLLALALLLEGASREVAAVSHGMSRQTLPDWVHRFNAAGISGLWSRTGPGRTPRLTAAQMAELKSIVIAGPDPARHKVTRWRCADLCEEVTARFSVSVCDQTMGRWLRQLGLTRLQPRPYHPKKDPAAQEAFKNNSRSW